MAAAARRTQRIATGLGVAILVGACASPDEATTRTPSAAAEDGVAAGWVVELLDDADLGEGWQARALPDPDAGVLDGLCGVPDILELFPTDQVVRYEGDGGVVTHALVSTDDAPSLATVLTTEIELCEDEDERVTSVDRVELDAELPPSDAFRVGAYEGLVDLTSDAVWIVTTVDGSLVSIVGASTTDLFPDPADPVELARRSVRTLYERRG